MYPKVLLDELDVVVLLFLQFGDLGLILQESDQRGAESVQLLQPGQHGSALGRERGRRLGFVKLAVDIHGEIDHVGVGEQIQLRRQELLLSINLVE